MLPTLEFAIVTFHTSVIHVEVSSESVTASTAVAGLLKLIFSATTAISSVEYQVVLMVSVEQHSSP